MSGTGRIAAAAGLAIVAAIGFAQERLETQGAQGERGWRASRTLAEEQTRRRPELNYLEERVPDLNLPDPLVMLDGTPVGDAEAWRARRRPEILELFRTHVYGRAPERPAGMTFTVTGIDAEAVQGAATRKDIAVNFTGRAEGPAMDMRLFTPNGGSGPAPTFLYLGRPLADEAGGRRWSDPLAKILARGYGLAVIDREGADPDEHDGFRNGVHGAFDPPGERPGDAWGTIGAWAWALSRAMDYLEGDEDVDRARVAVMGVSRAGKTALWAGAQDERFALTISICSGCGGAALGRRRFGETVARINASFPHWFCANFHGFGGREDELPVDQHMLLAAIAPRAVYVMSADTDLWADPRGEFLACMFASPVYRLLGVEGLGAEAMPPLDSPIHEGRIGYHIRPGGHGLEEGDWLRFMDFADKQFVSGP